MGVNVSTIKRWTDSGKLNCIKSVGGHRKFLMTHLSEFLDEYKKQATKVSLFSLDDQSDLEINLAILKKDFDFLTKFILKQSFESNRSRIQQVLNGLYLAQFSLATIYDQIITPVLHRIGDLWESKKILIVNEHLASQAIKDAVIRLQGIITIPKEKKQNVLCLNFSNELHDIALKMIDNLLDSHGYNVFYSGPQTPLFNINEVFELYKPIFACTSITTIATYTQHELDTLSEICESYQADLYIGGSAVRALNTKHLKIKAIVNNFNELEKVTKRY